MAYTVKQVAAMSGVSVRAFHFYDETGLLKPAYHGPNGYRFYDQQEVAAAFSTVEKALNSSASEEISESFLGNIRRSMLSPDTQKYGLAASHSANLSLNDVIPIGQVRYGQVELIQSRPNEVSIRG